MSALKLFTILLFTFFLFSATQTRSEVLSAGKTSELNSQIIQEIKEVLKIPYLKFDSKNLNGEIKVNAEVSKEGKIIFRNIKGLNEDLQANVIAKLNSLNLWTSTDYSSKSFEYRIRYRN
ncbi:MAG: hypothetical protein ABI462_10675 [Ignavibacteria bacterium]